MHIIHGYNKINLTIFILILLEFVHGCCLTSPYSIKEASGFQSGIVTLINDASSSLTNGTYSYNFRQSFNTVPQCMIGLVAYQGATVIFTEIAIFQLQSKTAAIFNILTTIGPNSNSKIVLLKISYLATSLPSFYTRSFSQQTFTNISSGTGLRHQTFVKAISIGVDLTNYKPIISLTGFGITSSSGYFLSSTILVTNSISIAITFYVDLTTAVTSDGVYYQVLLYQQSTIASTNSFYVVQTQTYQQSSASTYTSRSYASIFLALTKFTDANSSKQIAFQWNFDTTLETLTYSYPLGLAKKMDLVQFVNIVAGQKYCNSSSPFWFNESFLLCTQQCTDGQYANQQNICTVCTSETCSTSSSSSSSVNTAAIIVPIILVVLVLIISLLCGYCIWRRYFSKNRIKPYRREVDMQTKNNLPDLTL